MINPGDDKKDDGAAQDKNQLPDSTTALCETLVSKLTEKDDKPKEKKQPDKSDKDEPVEISDSDDESDEEESYKDDDESDWSSASASPAPLKTPRAFEKSDHLYGKKLEKKKEGAQEIEDWSWDSEGSAPEERMTSKQTHVIQKRNKK